MVDPSTETFVLALSGVAGSIIPRRTFLSSGTFVIPGIQFGLPWQGSLLAVSFFTYNLGSSAQPSHQMQMSYVTGNPTKSANMPIAMNASPPRLQIPLFVKISQSLSLSLGSGLCK